MGTITLPEATHLDAPIPYLEVKPVGRVLKTKSSQRELPLVGAALAAMKLRPMGFPRYGDKSSALSATLNKFVLENGLRPTKDHTVYSLRHSFKDRLVAAQAPDSTIDNLMGHASGKPRYGDGPPLELKLKFLESIAFKPPSRLWRSSKRRARLRAVSACFSSASSASNFSNMGRWTSPSSSMEIGQQD